MDLRAMLYSSSPLGENEFTFLYNEWVLNTLDMLTKDEIDFSFETQQLDSLKGFEEFQMEYT